MQHALLVAILGLSASAQNPPRTAENWGPAKQGVRVALSLDKLTYAVGEPIPLHIAAQVLSAERPLYGVPDRKSGAFFMKWDFARAFQLSILDESGHSVGNDMPSNLQFVISGSSGPPACPVPLEVGHVYALEQTATRKQALLPTEPGTYRLRVTWGPYAAADPPCGKSDGAIDSQAFRPFVTVSSLPITIHVIRNP